jgi:hypothetical protein
MPDSGKWVRLKISSIPMEIGMRVMQNSKK